MHLSVAHLQPIFLISDHVPGGASCHISNACQAQRLHWCRYSKYFCLLRHLADLLPLAAKLSKLFKIEKVYSANMSHVVVVQIGGLMTITFVFESKYLNRYLSKYLEKFTLYLSPLCGCNKQERGELGSKSSPSDARWPS